MKKISFPTLKQMTTDEVITFFSNFLSLDNGKIEKLNFTLDTLEGRITNINLTLIELETELKEINYKIKLHRKELFSSKKVYGMKILNSIEKSIFSKIENLDKEIKKLKQLE